MVRKPMILIVEDDPLARRALRSLFIAHGYETDAVESAEDALERLEDEHKRLHMVLIDIDLPGMNGLELLRRLQRDHPEIPCTLMSAAEHDLTLRAGQRAVPFLPKPLDLRRLFTLVQDEGAQSLA